MRRGLDRPRSGGEPRPRGAMVKRVALSALLLPPFALAVRADFLHSLPFFVVILALSVLASRELESLLKKALPGLGLELWAPALYAPAELFLVVAYLRTFSVLGEGVLFVVAGALLVVLLALPPALCLAVGGTRRPEARRPEAWRHGGHRGALKVSAAVACVFLYTGVFPYTIFSMRGVNGGTALVYALFGLVWLSDAAAYFAGSLFGRTRGIVKASPNKSLEGYVASFAVTVGAAAALPLLVPGAVHFPFAGALLVGLVVAVAAPAGDLAESALKRKAGVKDSSRLLPSFGGVLDIFDSVLASAPFYFILVKIQV